MTQQEFTQRTGFFPTASQFDAINAEYMATDIDKDTFCKEWKRKGGILEMSRESAQYVATLEMKLREIQKVLDSHIFKSYDKIDELDTESKRRGYFSEMCREIKNITDYKPDTTIPMSYSERVADAYKKYYR